VRGAAAHSIDALKEEFMLAPTNDFARSAVTFTADGTVEGYASLFGELDQARDMVMPGAFEASLRQRGVRRVPMLFQHDPAEPIGVWLELREDVRGLYARGRLIPEVLRARELLALLKAGTADGLSIGFRTVKGRVDPKTRIRRLEAIDLWEISIVTFPLLPGARLARASKASGQREPLQKDAAPGPRIASLHSAARPHAVKEASSRPPHARTRRPVMAPDPALARFQPERLFRQQPRFRFGKGQDRLSWRELVMPDRALRARGLAR
jgi:HK97 family phage prohead protease